MSRKVIGPQMARAIELVRSNPGCTKMHVASQLHEGARTGRSLRCGYDPVNRAIREGHIKAVRVRHNRFALYVATCALLLSSLASAAPKKPSVCQDFRVSESVDTDGKRARMGVCFDSEKPAIWSSWTIVDVVAPDGAKRRYAVGFR